MNIPCKYMKTSGGEFLSKDEASLYDIGDETASTLMARDFKGHRASGHNLVIVSNVRQVGNIKAGENRSWDNPQVGRVYDPDAVSPTLTTVSGGDLVPYILTMNNSRIRRLTPREYWRLMGFTDEDYDKAEEVTSKSKLYFEAGNSIVVPVLEAIFKQMIKEDE